ncbi:hypothetical protein AMECASPLE_002620 [Ameca splendens]|uniref:Uncharacterized protein n=1 Tax=Ameca splendens TaxID=208324 RepID=A0ABV0ZIE6_9TELE
MMQNKPTSSCLHLCAGQFYIRVFVLIWCVWFSPNWLRDLIPKIEMFGHDAQQRHCFTRLQTANFSHALIFFRNKPLLFSPFLIVLSWRLTFNLLTEACEPLSVISI